MWFQHEGPPDIKGIDRSENTWWETKVTKEAPKVTKETLRKAMDKGKEYGADKEDKYYPD